MGKKLLIGFMVFTAVAVPLISVVGWKSVTAVCYRLAREAFRIEADFTTRGFAELEGEHFIVRYQSIDSDIAPMVLKAAEDSFASLVRTYGYENRNKIMLIVYPDEEQMIKSLRWPLEKSPMGVYQGGVIKILSPYLWIDEGQEIDTAFRKDGPVAHELTHLLVDYQTNGNHARWFTEGLAQYMEVRLGGSLWFGKQEFSARDALPLSRLEQSFDNDKEQVLAYWQAYSMLEYFMQTYGEKGVKKILAELKRGTNMEPALQKVTGRDYRGFLQDWQQWMESGEKADA